MANNLFISYDLMAPDKNYEKLIAGIKSLGDWAKAHYSLWYVKSTLSASGACDKLAMSIDANDKLLVVDATNNNAAWHNLDPKVTQYIRERWML